MMNQYYTVEQISEMLDIHVKTIQRYIREGKLQAVKIGKGWRVTGHDLSVFTEQREPTFKACASKKAIQQGDRVSASAVVDVSSTDRNEAIRLMNTLTAAQNSKPPDYGHSSMQAQYIEAEGKIRITLWGGMRFMTAMMEILASLIETDEMA